MTRDASRHRRAAYERLRWIAGGIGAAPLLLVYVLLHTPYLRAFLPDSKFLSLLILFFGPLGWLFGVTRLYGRWGARHFDLQCLRCGAALVDEEMQPDAEARVCRRCGADLDDGQSTGPGP